MMRKLLTRLILIVTLVATADLALASPAVVAATPSFDCAVLLAGSVTTPTASPSPTKPAPAAFAFPANGGKLTVFAAASLTDAFTQMGKELETAHPGLKITFNFAGSQTLVTQLDQGAPADLFASANQTQMKDAQSKGLIAGEPAIFVKNRLAIVVPRDNPAGIASPADLAKPGLKLVLAAPDVPVGRYARQSLCEMGKDTAAYGGDFVARVAGNVVSEEQDVREVLAKVELGEADAGVVYVSDVSPDATAKVKLIEIPAPVNVLATYPIAPVKGGNAALANAFIAYVLSPAGQATLQQYGFTPVS